MKKMRMLSLTLVMALCCSLLTGCMGAVGEVKVNADGSGVITLSAGMTKDALEMMASMDETGADVNFDEYTAFEHNGVTYYGSVQTDKFSSVDEFNKVMQEDVMEGSTNGVDSGSLSLVKNTDGSFTLTLVVTPETGDTTELEQSAAASDMDAAMIETLFKDFAVAYQFEFPTAVKQIAGPTGGITITGNKVVMDIMKLDPTTTNVTYVFTTGATQGIFTDVQYNAWYFEAVNAMAKGGLVAGIGNNKFNPEGTLTYAQFCTILARAKSLETGTENGYWAYKSIESCIEAGYIFDRGEINSKNYDVAIPREAAVAAMYKGKQVELSAPLNTLTSMDIPDFDKISDEYKEDILKAYNYGITGGMDTNRTFAPLNNLTRAQVCQLFYNLDWTTPMSDLGNASN